MRHRFKPFRRKNVSLHGLCGLLDSTFYPFKDELAEREKLAQLVLSHKKSIKALSWRIRLQYPER